MEEDIVLVTIQYRLNVFGFMSTEDSTSPGNYGSLDQVEALKWIQENIAAYGGDPDQVLSVYSSRSKIRFFSRIIQKFNGFENPETMQISN